MIGLANWLNRFRKKTAGGGGGGGSYAFINSATAFDGVSATTAGFDSTGAKLIVINVSYFSGAVTISDSKGNSYTPLTNHIDASGAYATRIYYCANPTVGTGHTFTVLAAFVVVNAMAFSFTGTTPTLDSENGFNHDSSTVSSWQPGSVTPSGNNELFVTCTTWNNPAVAPTASIDSSFTGLIQSQEGGNNLYGAAAYKIQTTGGAENPTWSFDNPVNAGAASVAVFK